MKYIYFAQSLLGDAIKVGVASDPEERVRELTASLLGTIEVDGNNIRALSLEGKIHDVLSAHRIVGEWYRPCPDLKALIQACEIPGKGLALIVGLWMLDRPKNWYARKVSA